MTEPLKATLHIYCPRKNCPEYGKPDNPIEKAGTYPVRCEGDRCRLFRCCGGKHKFSETSFSGLWGKQGSFKEYEQAAKLAGYGLGAEKTADVLSKDVRTIDVWLGEIAGKSRLFHLWLSAGIGLVIRFLQLDELWSYVTRKDRQCWVFAALDVPSRFWIGFVLGKRTYRNAKRMLDMVFSLGNWSSRRMLRITSDKLAAYKKAIGICFKDLQIVKRRYKRRLVIVKKEFVKGEDKDFPGKTQNTSFIERLNLTIRQWCPFLKRKTLGYCKKENALSDALWINLFHYNYRHFHKSLKVRLPGRPNDKKFVQKYRQRTPAMAMGLTRQSLTWKFLFPAPVQDS